MMAKGSASGFEDSLEALKQQCAENERVIKQLSTAKSDLNGKITALQKEKG
jgi:chromosome segregation ATPase